MEDLARATVAMVTDMAFGKAMDLSIMFKAYQVYYGGSVTQHELIRREILRRYTMWVMVSSIILTNCLPVCLPIGTIIVDELKKHT